MTGEILDITEGLDLGTDDGSDAAEHVAAARGLLLTAAMQVGDASNSVNDAWQQMSSISVRN